jgi:hypothetical protein
VTLHAHISAKEFGMKHRLDTGRLLAAIGLFALSVTGPVGIALAQTRSGEITYLSGGITSDEADELRLASRGYSLAAQFARRGSEGGVQNDFAADVHVRILDKGGRVLLDAPGQGPIFLAQLPEGRYTIEAEFDGQTKRQQVNIRNGGHQSIGFLWGAERGDSLVIEPPRKTTVK